jgi:hypothetical protein
LLFFSLALVLHLAQHASRIHINPAYTSPQQEAILPIALAGKVGNREIFEMLKDAYVLHKIDINQQGRRSAIQDFVLSESSV